MTTATIPQSIRSNKRFSLHTAVFGFAMVLTGIASLIHEYVFSTVFTYILGGAIEQFSMTIGVMFLAMAVGAKLQKRITRGMAEVFVLIEVFLGLLGAFAPIVLQWSYVHLDSSFDLIKYAYMALPGVAVGMEIPLMMRLNEWHVRDLRTNISQTWGLDYVGGAIGVWLWLQMLRHQVPLFHISFVIGSCNIAVAIVTLWYFRRRGMLEFKYSGRLLTPVALLTVIAMMFGVVNVAGWTAKVSQSLYDDPIIFQVTTKYQNIVLTEGPHPTDPSSHNWQLWLNGNKQFSSLDEAIYHEYLVHPAMNLAAQHKRVLVLGGGDGLAMREILKYPDVEEVTLVDLDPEMIEFAKTNPAMVALNGNSFGDARVSAHAAHLTDTGKTRDVVLDTDQVKKANCQEVVREDGVRTSQCETVPVTEKVGTVDIFTIDADKFFDAPSEPWDVVIVDLPDPSSIELAKLYSTEFYGKIKKSMSPDGIVVVQSTSPYHSKETFLCIMRSMAAAGLTVVPYHDNVPSFGDWGWNIGSPSLNQKELYDRANSLKPFEVETREVEARGMQRALIFDKGWLQPNTDKISTLMDPVVYQLYVDEGWKVE